MARSDLLISLVKAAMEKNVTETVKVTEEIISEEHAKNHRVLSKKLSEIIRLRGDLSESSNMINTCRSNLIHESEPQMTFSDLCISKENRSVLEDFKQEYFRQELLNSYGLEPRNRVMLIGPPGNGKTSLAEAISSELMLPLMTVQYETLIGSLLGETSGRLSKIFEQARLKRCVLFFDEFDAISKKRGDTHETGEIKRIVNSLLLQLDNFPSRSIVIVASNHPELIDSAAWRRFQIRLKLDPPGSKETLKYLSNYEKRTSLNFGLPLDEISKKIHIDSFAELEEFCRDILRKAVLGRKIEDASKITKLQIAELKIRNKACLLR